MAATMAHVSISMCVYDLTPLNNHLYRIGLGIFHSGIKVYGLEYGFSSHDYPSSRVFEVKPRSCPGFIFRRSVLIGSLDISQSEFQSFSEEISRKYHGDSDHLIAKNCTHFTNEVCAKLIGKSIPVNRLARIGDMSDSVIDVRRLMINRLG